MTFAGWARLKERAQTFLATKLAWLTSERRDFHGLSTSEAALVVVIGREHYDERRVQYPVRSWFELSRVLRLETAGRGECISIIGPMIDDRREVTFFDLKDSIAARVGRAAFWVPESLLLSRAVERGEIVTIDRDQLQYYLAQGAISQRVGGLVRTPELFAFASGIAQETASVWSDESDLRARMLKALAALESAVWIRCLSPSITDEIRARWKPVSAIAAATFVAYMLLASLYLHSMIYWREHQIQSLGPEVGVLIAAQRHTDRLAEEQHGAARVLEGRRPTYFVWQVAATVWEKSGRFEALSWSDDQVLLRGKVQNAVDLLKALSALEGVEGARFVAPVTDDAGEQSFAIKLKLVGKGA